MALVREKPGKRKECASLAKQLNVEKAKTFSSFFSQLFLKSSMMSKSIIIPAEKKYKISAWNRGRMG